jgi:hypothetical protein
MHSEQVRPCTLATVDQPLQLEIEKQVVGVVPLLHWAVIVQQVAHLLDCCAQEKAKLNPLL